MTPRPPLLAAAPEHTQARSTAPTPAVAVVRPAATGRPDHGFAARYGPWAIVTGASDGIGRAFAVELAARGLNLVLVARRAAPMQTLAAELQGQHGIVCRVIPLDLAAAHAEHDLDSATGDLDIGLLVAAAGFGTSGPLTDSDIETEAAMLQLNCGAVLRQCWQVGQRLAAQRRGGLVLLSSIVAFQGTPLSAHYAATKAYVQTLAEGLNRELKPHGVDVIAAAPGPVGSGFAARANMHMTRSMSPQQVARQTLSALGHAVTVRPGWLSKLLGWSLAMTPRPLRVRIMGRIMAGMTAHQRVASPR